MFAIHPWHVRHRAAVLCCALAKQEACEEHAGPSSTPLVRSRPRRETLPRASCTRCAQDQKHARDYVTMPSVLSFWPEVIALGARSGDREGPLHRYTDVQRAW